MSDEIVDLGATQRPIAFKYIASLQRGESWCVFDGRVFIASPEKGVFVVDGDKRVPLKCGPDDIWKTP